MIPEPHRTYILELLTALGTAAEDFVLVGGQALKFALQDARATKDFDFVLDVLSIRERNFSLASALHQLGYAVVPDARNFQFEKRIPNSAHIMRVELMAPQELKRRNDFRVDVGDQVHARACAGGAVILAESDPHEISGLLPSGAPSRVVIRVTRPHALVFMKCLAMEDRHRNLRGIEHYEHDRDSARTHVADIVDVLAAQAVPNAFRDKFIGQFDPDPDLRKRVATITQEYFARDDSPGLLLYEEHLAERADLVDDVVAELRRARRLLSFLVFD